MPLRTAARKCPEATFLPSDPAAYDEASEQVMGLLRDLGHPLEVWGWDEAYLGADVDDPVRAGRAHPRRRRGRDRAVVLGRHQRQQAAGQGGDRIRQAGRAVYRLTDDNWMAVMGDRGVDALWGVGPKTTETTCRPWYHHGRRPCGHRRRAARRRRSGRRRAVDPVAGQGRRRHERQRRAVGAPVAQPRGHVPRGPDRPRRDGRGRSPNWRAQTLAEVVEQGRTVTRVAVTVRTKTFFTRTKIRKLPAREHRRRRPSSTPRCRTVRSVRSGSAGAAARRPARIGDAGGSGAVECHREALTSSHAAHRRHPRLPLAARGRRSADAASPSSPAPTAPASRRCTARCGCSPTAAAAR